VNWPESVLETAIIALVAIPVLVFDPSARPSTALP
jgi:hypothetical protein